MSRLKYFIKNRLNAKSSYFILICVFSLLLVVVGTSFAIFTFTSSKSGVLNIKTGTLVSSMTSGSLSRNSITVGAFNPEYPESTVGIIIVLKNINSIPTKVNLYYKVDSATVSDVVVSYDLTGDAAPPATGYILDVGETKRIQVVIDNKSASSQTIVFGTDVGLKNQPLTLLDGYSALPIIKCSNSAVEANAPVMSSNLIPIKYDGTQWVKANINNTGNDWYNYKTGMWANAVTVTEATRATYQSAAIDTPILEADILTYLVWVPRYKYSIDSAYIGLTSSDTKTVTPLGVCINFESKTTPKSTGTAQDGSMYTHPAFTFGTTELSGMWVGKFEMTGTISALTIKPNLPSVRSQRVKATFDTTLAMKDSGNVYGYSVSGVDTHMMKNMEWGAVAYLSQSKYGKYGNYDYTGENKEVYINPSNGNITGRSGTTPAQAQAADATGVASANLYGYDGASCSSKTGFVCTGEKQSIYGMAGSTTGTIYGIYDMSGGALEYVMGNYNNAISSSGFVATWFTDSSNAKYYDKYTQTTALLSYNSGLKGDSLYETQSWYSNSISAFSSAATNPWFTRGGTYTNTKWAGPFSSANGSGGAVTGTTWRFVQTE